MSQLDDLPPLREVIEAHGLAPKKNLGQNFLLDLNLTARIARVAGRLDKFTVIEVGPGPGGLTRALLSEGARKIIAIERDDRCLSALAEIADHYPDRLDIIADDALKVDYGKLADGPTCIIANLPYNIATPLLTGWLEGKLVSGEAAQNWPPFFQSLTLMFQREVGQRICAQPGDKAYGRLSVLANYLCETYIAFDVDARAFTPPPKVTSCVVHLVPRPTVSDISVADLSHVTQAAFGQRRKMLRVSLKVLGLDALALIEAAGLIETQRAETVSIEGFVNLARAYRAAKDLAL